ncbi:MAG: glycosyltransferase family 2 protein [Bacteroidia bacterium]
MLAAFYIFWIGTGIIVYTYIGYAMLMFFLVMLKRIFSERVKPVAGIFEPDVSLVIPCYNERAVLERKVENCFSLDYPKNKLQIIFITDGSTDGSPDFLKRYNELIVLHEDKRAGKSTAENRAMQFVKTPFVIFCDANTDLNSNAIREMIKHYQDEKVGAVAGEKRVKVSSRDAASAAGEGIYWQYESLLKKLDSELYSTVGGAGELISFRCSLYSALEEDTILDDFIQSMRIALMGYKVIYEPNAYAEEYASASVNEELKRKIRISAGAWQSMGRLVKAFNPFRNFFLAFNFISHKVLRWTLAPLSLFLILPANYFLLVRVGGIYSYLFYGQLIFYVLAMLGWILENNHLRVKILFIPYYFFVTNWCMYLGFFRFISGKQSVKWEPTRRASSRIQ